MCASRKIFKSRLKWCQNNQHQIKMDIIADKHASKDFRGFWKSTSKLNSGPGLPVSVNGCSDTRDIANLFKDHFYVRSQLGPSGEMLNAEKPEGKVGLRFRAKDVENVIRHMSRGKSPGHDGLSIEHLQYGGAHISRVLSLFCNLCMSHSYLPPDLIKTIVIPVVKNKSGDMSDLGNYRPISLATIIAKVLDRLLEIQLNKHLQIHDNQFGFRPKLSTECAIMCLKQTVRYYTDRGTPIYACFLDLSKAFDLVSYDILWKKLKEENTPPEVINIFRYWYGNQVNNVRWAGQLSDSYKMECGVRQGGLTSPVLFNLYINALIVTLSNEHVGCHIDDVCVNNLSYADDMVLLSASVCGLRRLLCLCEGYAQTHGLKYNEKKSQVMVFKSGTKYPTNIPPLKINGTSLERVDSFKYLGHVVASDLRDDMDMERERRALSVRANMVSRRFVRCSTGAKTTLFRAYCTTFYTCSLWITYTRRSYESLRIQYNNAFRMLLGLPRYCSASGMFADAHVDGFSAIMRKRIASMVSRVRASTNSILNMIAYRVDSPYMNNVIRLHV